MRESVARRLLFMFPIMAGVSFLTFITFRVIHGGAAHLIKQCGEWLGGAGGTVTFFGDPWSNVQTFFPPALALALGIAAVTMRLTRLSTREVMRSDYIRIAWANVLRGRGAAWRHALKNAMIPVDTLIALRPEDWEVPWNSRITGSAFPADA